MDIRLALFHKADDPVIVHLAGSGCHRYQAVILHLKILDMYHRNILAKHIDRFCYYSIPVLVIANIKQIDRIENDLKVR